MINDLITSVAIRSTLSLTQTNVPITFAQVFKAGDVPAGTTVVSDSHKFQVNAKAWHPDGSLRHAVFSTILPMLGAGEVYMLPLKRGVRQPAPELVNLVIGAAIRLSVGGVDYRVTATPSGGDWLAGPVVTETEEAFQLFDENRNAHPHLEVRIASRCYATGAARVEVIIENTKAYAPAPRNYTYDLEIAVGGEIITSQKGVLHPHHARQRIVAWFGEEPKVHIIHDRTYLDSAMAVPHYDPTLAPNEKALAKLEGDWGIAKQTPFGPGLAYYAMPTTGGRNDIGLLPSWTALYLISMDERAKAATLGTADKAGSWSIHYRDEKTGLPISLIEHPYMTVFGTPTDTKNPKTKLQEAFPKLMAGAATNKLQYDTAHAPSLSYVPYLLTGEHYYLEELQFQAMYDVFNTNPGYRKNIQGLVQSLQVRGQAWALRTLGHAAYITPDAHPLKRHFHAIMSANLAWYNAEYSNNPDSNKLGVITNGAAATGYAEDVNGDGTKDPKTAVAPWQDDFFTQAMGHLVELGFRDALPILQYKLKFPIGRLTDPGFCWMVAAHYTIAVRPAAEAPLFDNFRDALAATIGEKAASLPCGSAEMGAALDPKQGVGDMGGYPSTATGFPSNLQPAVAYSAQFGAGAGNKAWEVFEGRSIKPTNYGSSPQFAIVPRNS